MKGFSIFLTLCAVAMGISCLDEHGSPVDWFAAIKAPKIDGTFPDG